jgi:prepilin-type processing-associated H-X9-DG protein
MPSCRAASLMLWQRSIHSSSSSRPSASTVAPPPSSNIMIVWDHGRTPGCANSTIPAPRGPWHPFADNSEVHYPQNRHGGVYNVLFCDGHVDTMRQNDLTDKLLYANGP